MDDKVQRCLTDGSEVVNDVVTDVTLRSDRLDPVLSDSTQWIPINDCLLTRLSRALTSEIIAKDCRSHSDLFTQQRRQTTQWLYNLTFVQSRNDLDILDARVLQPRVVQLSYYCRRWTGPWRIYVLSRSSLSALPGFLSRGGHSW